MSDYDNIRIKKLVLKGEKHKYITYSFLQIPLN